MSIPKILIYDIETSPIEAYVWTVWEPSIRPNQIKKDWFIMSWSAKWLGGKTIYQQDQRSSKTPSNDAPMVSDLVALIEEADVIITFNGKKFDNRKVSSRQVLGDILPGSPKKQIDVCELAKRRFGFTYNSLEYLAKILKTRHQKMTSRKYAGMDLWVECLKGNKSAWNEMAEYNKLDTVVLEEVYEKLRPWDNRTSLAVYRDSGACNCGSKSLVRRGFSYTKIGKFQQFQCRDCGSWTRDSKNLMTHKPKVGI